MTCCRCKLQVQQFEVKQCTCGSLVVGERLFSDQLAPGPHRPETLRASSTMQLCTYILRPHHVWCELLAEYG